MKLTKYKIKQFAKIVAGGTPSTKNPAYWEGNIPWITPNDLTSYKKIYISKGERNITLEGLTKSSAKLLPPKTVLLTTRAPVGYVAIAKTALSTNQGFKNLICDENKADPEFIYYILKKNKSFLQSHATGSTFGELSGSRLRNLEFNLPELNIQKKIAQSLSSYDDLIDTNRRRIQLLEESARLLFREWFVYFRFPGHEKVKMVDLGVRRIPAGWDYLPFTKIILFKKAPLGVPVFTDTRQYYQTSEIDGTSITGNGEEVDYENRPSRADITPRINTIYFAKMKDTDKVLYFNKGNTYLLEKVLLSTGMVGFTADEKYLGFLFGLLTSYEFVQYKNNFATGATQVSLNDASLKKIKVLFPALNLVELYSEIVNPLLEECSLLRSQNQKLAQTRDLLLPRLMNGEIDPVRYDELSNGVEV